MTYELYASGNVIDEVELNRDPGRLDPALLRGERDVVSGSVMIGDTETLRVTTWEDQHGQWEVALIRLPSAA